MSMDLFSDEQGHARERRVDNIDPAVAENVGQSGAPADRVSGGGEREIDRELGRERGDEKPWGRRGSCLLYTSSRCARSQRHRAARRNALVDRLSGDDRRSGLSAGTIGAGRGRCLPGAAGPARCGGGMAGGARLGCPAALEDHVTDLSLIHISVSGAGS